MSFSLRVRQLVAVLIMLPSADIAALTFQEIRCKSDIKKMGAEEGFTQA